MLVVEKFEMNYLGRKNVCLEFTNLLFKCDFVHQQTYIVKVLDKSS